MFTISLRKLASYAVGAACAAASALFTTPATAQSSATVALVRYTTSGALDSSFSGNGKLSLNIAGSSSEVAEAAVLVANGKIVVAGSAIAGAGSVFMVARFNSNGSLDTSFSGDGIALTDFASTSGEGATSVAVDSNGKLVAAGFADGQFALARYNTNGSLDTTFDGDGKVLTDFAGAAAAIQGVTIASNGRIVVAGYARDASFSSQFALARYNTSGSLDTTFDGDGKVLTDFSSAMSEGANDIAIDTNGKIVAAGFASLAGSSQMAIARYNTNGGLDTTYDADGKVLIDFLSSVFEEAFSVVIDSSNRVVVGGSADGQFALGRTLATGAPDTSFDGDGKVLSDFSSQEYESIHDIALSGSKIVAVGSATNLLADGSYWDNFAAARYNSSGSLDGSFDDDGKVLTDVTSSQSWQVANATAVDSAGKIVAAGGIGTGTVVE